MGLDTDIYRVNRKKAEAAMCDSYTGEQYVDYWSIHNDVKSIVYARKYYDLYFLLCSMYKEAFQCEYFELTKLKAYHLLYCMQQRYKRHDAEDRKRAAEFVRDFKQILHNFDWDRDMMVWNWT